jgi:hypothetical protein
MGRVGKKDRQGGRPKLAEGEAREHRLTVRLNAKEQEQMLLKSQATKLEASVFARAAILGARLSVRSGSHPVNVQTYEQLRRLGNNLNQLLRQANAGLVVGIEAQQIEQLRCLLGQVGMEMYGDREADEG